MPLGVKIRHRLGRYESPAAETYRAIFINLDDLVRTLTSLCSPRRILEIGCGDGSVATRLVAALPSAEYLGIDVAPEPGRRFEGDRSRAEFRSMRSSELVAEQRGWFDLVLVVDVLHHVPGSARLGLLSDAVALTAPGGMLAVKDWERDRSLAHALCFGSDRYISGDREVAFMSAAELRSLVTSVRGGSHVLEARIPPWRNNVLHVLRVADERASGPAPPS